MHQWGEGYPSEAVITADMERNGGFVVEDDGKVVGYYAFLPSPEPTYAKIYEGDWLDDERLAYQKLIKSCHFQDFFHLGLDVE
jgi:hypothetical protein